MCYIWFISSSFIVIFIISCTKSKKELAREKQEFKSLIAKADKLYYNCDYVSALKYYLKAHKLFSKNCVLLYKIGFCYDKGENNLKKAKKYYLKSLKYLDTNKELNYVAAAYFNLGVIAGKEKELEKKYDYFVSAYSLLVKLEEMDSATGVDLFRLAYYYMDNKDDELAIKYYKKAIKKLREENPNHFYYAGAYFNIGIIYWNRGDFKKTLYYWGKALKLEPDNPLYKEWYEKALIMEQEL